MVGLLKVPSIRMSMRSSFNGKIPIWILLQRSIVLNLCSEIVTTTRPSDLLSLKAAHRLHFWNRLLILSAPTKNVLGTPALKSLKQSPISSLFTTRVIAAMIRRLTSVTGCRM